MPKVSFRISEKETIDVTVEIGERIMDIARNSGIYIDAPCSGNGTCGKCRVQIVDGDAESHPTRHITDEDYAAGWRLACETKVTGDVTVLVPETASAFRTGIRTADLNDPTVRAAFDDVQNDLKAAGVMGDPAVFTCEITMDPPTLEDTLCDTDRIERAVKAAIGQEAKLSLYALRKLAQVLREDDFHVRCVLSRDEDCVHILDVGSAKSKRKICGLAIDIGTTTVTAALVDMETGELLARGSAGNAQIRYGADVINRIIESGRDGGRERLRRAVVDETLIPLIGTLCRKAKIYQKQIYRACIAGNTTMSHLLLGLYADPVRMEPFIPSFFQCHEMRLNDVLSGLHPEAKLVLTPNVGSYVGGDITSGLLACTLWNRDELELFIDLGTNGEIVLGSSEFLFTCACSAGPAFEGGDISCGMRATNGAIEKVRIDKETMEPTLSIIGSKSQKPLGLCGSGIIDTVAELFRGGIISAKGKFAREGERIRYDEHGMGRYVLAFEDQSADGREVSINEVDLDNFIRAKGAIFSAILLMLRQLGMEPSDLTRIQIAGGIGGGIDFPNAITIGIFPDLPLEKFSYIGNSSLSGAYAVLLSREAAAKVRELGSNMTYVELSNEPGYMDEFVSACFLPHTNAELFPSVEV
ncbi:MAG: DUF4445 domain-containing protein [Oscillospiraceae bacterium]|nr:DUF4445 domain-containing protein [Oscillospiraceae bacterium]